MGLKINGDYLFYTIKEQLHLKEVSNDAIAEIIAALFVDEKLEKSVGILNLALLKLLKTYQQEKEWTEREERQFREAKSKLDRGKKYADNDANFVPDDIAF